MKYLEPYLGSDDDDYGGDGGGGGGDDDCGGGGGDGWNEEKVKALGIWSCYHCCLAKRIDELA